MEKFLPAIPGSFNTDWGMEVWKKVGQHHESGDQSQDELVTRPIRDTTAHRPSSSWSIRGVFRPIIHLVRNRATRHPPTHPPTHTTTRSLLPHPPNVHRHSTTAHIRGENAVHELCTRVAHTVEICKNRNLFANNDLWRKRTRACIGATASLVCCVNAELAWFGGIPELLRDIGYLEKMRELSLAGTDELFVRRWTCLSLMAIRPILADHPDVQSSASQAVESFARPDDIGNNDALAGAQKIDKTLQKARDCLLGLRDALPNTEDLTEVKENLGGHESLISELEQIDFEADRLNTVDSETLIMQLNIDIVSYRITSQFPGILDDLDLYDKENIPFSLLSRDPRNLQFIWPGKTLKSMCSPALTLRNILQGQGNADAYKELLKNLENIPFSSWQGDEMQRQLSRVEDLCGGGLGFTVKLFFLAFDQLLSTSPSIESHSTLYTGTFRAITSDWSKHKGSLGTQNILLDIATSRLWEFGYSYPAYIVDEFLLLLGKIFDGQTGTHIDNARQQFESDEAFDPCGFKKRVIRALTSGQA